MGTWGTCTFDDDDTRDWLDGTISRPLVKFVEDHVSFTDRVRSKEILAAVAVLVTLYGQFREPPGLRA